MALLSNSLYLQMDSYTPFLTSIPTLTFFFFFFLTTLPPQSDCCPAYNCGNLTDISYPFFGGNRSIFCGRPGFELECMDNQITKFIGFHPHIFIVLEINQTDHGMKMVPEFVYNQTVGHCEHTNTSLNPNLCKYPPTVHNINIFYNCSPGFQIGVNSCSCRPDSEKQGFYVDENILRDYPQFLHNCRGHIQVPATQSIHWEQTGGIDALRRALVQGFDVLYNMRECSECPKSAGVCGSSKDAPFVCYAYPKAPPDTHPSSSTNNSMVSSSLSRCSF